MLFAIALSIILAFCIITTVILGTRLMRKAYEKRFTKNVKRHLDVLPKKKEPESPLPSSSGILSFSLLERFYAQQQPQLTLPYKMAQTESYIKNLPPMEVTGPLPPIYEEIDLTSPAKVPTGRSSPPPSYSSEGKINTLDV